MSRAAVKERKVEDVQEVDEPSILRFRSLYLDPAVYKQSRNPGPCQTHRLGCLMSEITLHWTDG